jgi:hypothetical protein
VDDAKSVKVSIFTAAEGDGEQASFLWRNVLGPMGCGRSGSAEGLTPGVYINGSEIANHVHVNQDPAASKSRRL